MIQRILLLAGMSACAMIGGSLVATFGPRLTISASAQAPPVDPTPSPQLQSADLQVLSDQFETIAQKVLPTVVAVEAKRTAKPTFQGGKERVVDESGSGVIIQAAGWSGYLVLTNNHVVGLSRPDQITVHLSDGRILTLIETFLKQGVLDDLREWTPEMGSPQGAVISPLLSNIYLNPLDHQMATAGFEMSTYGAVMHYAGATPQEVPRYMALYSIFGGIRNSSNPPLSLAAS